ncbi:aspartic proteinase cdr1 [Quercus suber]|uniref:Aspartic proteinase cdr1 n=1 Tax=Quercus suber TaxID=58331 RepID=A0AAW0KEY8_QUESU
MSYGDRSFSNGNLAIDTLTLGSTTSHPMPLPKTIIGHNITIFPSNLYPGFETVVKAKIDLAPTEDPSGVLSLCYESSSDDYSGPSITAHFTGTDVKLSSSTTFIKVDEQVVCLAFIVASDERVGTILQSNLYPSFESAVKAEIDLAPTEDPSGVLSLCYESSSDDFSGPSITAHFTGADVKLSTSTTFIRVDEQVVFLAFIVASDERVGRL